MKEGGRFVQVSGERALDQIADKLKCLLDKHGPHAVAYMGGGQGCHFEAAFSRTFLTGHGIAVPLQRLDRHSTATSYLQVILLALCGRYFKRGWSARATGRK